ncbi:hypothetical protein RLOC_00007234 [Lonchura striata]|uniref:Uncharacterized protein n=1 Tax=Lonchura striata TaxID=40157 RepID=A0A218V886_9PASE|nr:hypothetical protein RLOC_00007234 [Lonchura striata domestica]
MSCFSFSLAIIQRGRMSHSQNCFPFLLLRTG